MLNLKNYENDAEICQKKAKIKIKFQKMMGNFLDSIPGWKVTNRRWSVCMYGAYLFKWINISKTKNARSFEIVLK